jgi:hypothetical protein
MFSKRSRIKSALLVVAVGIPVFWTVSAIAQKNPPGQKNPPAAATADTVALGEPEVKALLLLMDTDQNGKVSRKEFMDFMQKEFDRLDKDKSGELDPRELAQSRLTARTFASSGK